MRAEGEDGMGGGCKWGPGLETRGFASRRWMDANLNPVPQARAARPTYNPVGPGVGETPGSAAGSAAARLLNLDLKCWRVCCSRLFGM